MSVPSKDDLLKDLKIPEVGRRLDRNGRPIPKNYINYGILNPRFNKEQSDGKSKKD